MTAPDLYTDARDFIAENAEQAAYWADLARQAATIADDTLLRYATRKAAAYARAFVGGTKDMLLAKEGAEK